MKYGKIGKNGFTLVEILFVIILLSVIVCVAVPRIMHSIQSANITITRASCKTLQRALDIEASNEGISIASLEQSDIENIVVPNHMVEMPNSPISGYFFTDVAGKVWFSGDLDIPDDDDLSAVPIGE